MGFAKMILICLSLFSVGVAAAQNLEPPHHGSDPEEGNWIELQGENSVMVPNVTFSRPEAGVGWTYPYKIHPIYHQNQTISGTFFGARYLANGTIQLRADKLSLSSFLGSVDVLDPPLNMTNVSRELGNLGLNATGDTTFELQAMPSGIYAIYVVDPNLSAPISASPLLVAETEIDVAVDTPSLEILAGDLVPVTVKLKSGPDRRVLHYAAFIVSAEDYRRLSLNLTGNGTLNGTLITATWNEDRLDIEADSDHGWDLLARLLMIFPKNSAAALQDSENGEIELYLITEDDWKPGSYFLTCAVLSDGTLVGLNQTEVVIA